jgi:hypothetical protein
MGKRLASVSAAALAALLMACTPSTEPAAEAPPGAADLTLACGGPFIQDASAASMRAAFGPENVTDEIVGGPEGAENNATVLFADDPARRMEILWADTAAQSGLLNASVYGETSAWTGPRGVTLGAALTSVETANGAPFKLAGFEWDFAGIVTDWAGGALAPTPDGCTFGVQFAPPPGSDAETFAQVAGDSNYDSDSPAMRAVAPIVVRMAIGFPAPAPD